MGVMGVMRVVGMAVTTLAVAVGSHIDRHRTGGRHRVGHVVRRGRRMRHVLAVRRASVMIGRQALVVSVVMRPGRIGSILGGAPRASLRLGLSRASRSLTNDYMRHGCIFLGIVLLFVHGVILAFGLRVFRRFHFG